MNNYNVTNYCTNCRLKHSKDDYRCNMCNQRLRTKPRFKNQYKRQLG